MAVAGVPEIQLDHAFRAVMAGLELQQYAIQLFEEKSDHGKPCWNIRIGINSGPLVAGVIGQKKFAYDVWGDTVNMASRMEAYGESGCVNITQSTYELLKNEVACSYRGEITVKHGKKLKAYLVHQVGTDKLTDLRV